MTGTDLARRIEQTAPLAYAVCRAMQQEVVKLGLSGVVVADPRAAAYRLATDPASAQDSLLGEWRDGQGLRQGGLAFHADGSFYAEFDVIRTHPRDERVFVEAVHAWGKGDMVKAEPRLMPVC